MAEQSHITPGNKVGILRRTFGVGQGVIAEILGVTRSTISAYENRSNASPSSEGVVKLARHFDVDVAWFYDGEGTLPTLGYKKADRSQIPLSERIREKLSGSQLESGHRFQMPAVEHFRFGGWSPGDGLQLKDEAIYEFGDPVPRNIREWDDPDPEAELGVLIAKDWKLGPRIQQGSQVLFRKDSFPPSGAIVLAENPSGTLQIRRLVLDPKQGPLLEPPYSYSGTKDARVPVSNGWSVWGGATKIINPYREGVPNVEVNQGQFLLISDHPFNDFDFQGSEDYPPKQQPSESRPVT